MSGHGWLLSLLAAWLVAVLLHVREGGPLDPLFRVATISLGLLQLAFLGITVHRIRNRPSGSLVPTPAARAGLSLGIGIVLGLGLWQLASSGQWGEVGDGIALAIVLVAFALALVLLLYLQRRSRGLARAGRLQPGYWVGALVVVGATLAGWWLTRTGTLGPAPGRSVMLAWLHAMAATTLCLGIAYRCGPTSRASRP